jgi:hypothetical protein
MSLYSHLESWKEGNPYTEPNTFSSLYKFPLYMSSSANDSSFKREIAFLLRQK